MVDIVDGFVDGFADLYCSSTGVEHDPDAKDNTNLFLIPTVVKLPILVQTVAIQATKRAVRILIIGSSLLWQRLRRNNLSIQIIYGTSVPTDNFEPNMKKYDPILCTDPYTSVSVCLKKNIVVHEDYVLSINFMHLFVIMIRELE